MHSEHDIWKLVLETVGAETSVFYHSKPVQARASEVKQDSGSEFGSLGKMIVIMPLL